MSASESTLDPTQRRAAKIVGFLYLVQMAAAIFGESFVRGRLVIRNDAAETALNIASSERLFRLGIAADLLTYLTVVVLVWGLYVILKPVNRNVALLAAFLRIAETAIASATVFNSFVALRLLSGADYLKEFEPGQLAVLARVFIGGQGTGLTIAFLFLGLGSTVFSYLWLKSRYVPRALAWLGIFASSLLTLGTLVIMVFPGVGVIGITYMIPMFFYEVGLGIWLLAKGLRAPSPA